MYLTNNEKTIHNLTVYSNEIYNKRDMIFGVYYPSWKEDFFYGRKYSYNIKPYGNIYKSIIITFKEDETILHNT